MENSNSVKTLLTETRKEELRNLWNDYIEDYRKKGKCKNIQERLNKITDDWKVYRDKINSDNFHLEDYTNLVKNNKSLPGGYLCNFLENTTSDVLGSSKPGTAINFGVKLNKDNETYTIRDNSEANKEKAQEYFNDHIKPLFKNIVKSENLSDYINHVESSNYTAKQILKKLYVLNHLSDFIFIYSNRVINDLYEELIKGSKKYNLEKNLELQRAMQAILGLSENDVVERVILSNFLWDYSEAESIVDENSPNVIIYGPPGTGKTYTIKKIIQFTCRGSRDRYEFVQFHPSYTYEDFIEGIKPMGVTKDGNIKFELVNGVFKRFCIKASKNPDLNYYFVVDEINRANLSSVLGETLLCLEKGYRHNPPNNTDNLIKTQYSALIEELIKDDKQYIEKAYYYDETHNNVYFGVPKNVFFIGMMNDVDKSIDAFDLALRRRFKWIRKDCDYDVIRKEVKYKNSEDYSNIEDYVKSCKSLNKYISKELNLGKSYEFGHSFFMQMNDLATKTKITKNNLVDLFNMHLRPTLKEYIRSIVVESELDDKLRIALEKFTKTFN